MMPQSEKPSASLIAYVAPFILYVVPTAFEGQGWLGIPYEVAYTLKELLVAATLIAFRRHYPAFSTAGFGLAALAGAAGCALWVWLADLQESLPALQKLIAAVQGSRVGYDPFGAEGSTGGRIAFVIVRLIGMAVVVPIMEEIFWRGFLARWLISEDFRKVPQGKFTTASFLLVTAAFATVHPEILAALAWGALINWLFRRTANVWACVVMHAVTNGLLGAYILKTGAWQLW